MYYKTPKLVFTLRKPSIAATNVWNSLPLIIRQLKSKLNFNPSSKNFTSRNIINHHSIDLKNKFLKFLYIW